MNPLSPHRLPHAKRPEILKISGLSNITVTITVSISTSFFSYRNFTHMRSLIRAHDKGIVCGCAAADIQHHCILRARHLIASGCSADLLVEI